MSATRTIAFSFLDRPWSLLVYETTDRHGEVLTRAAAYCDEDPAPRGPRGTWTVRDDDSFALWGPTYVEWPELDDAAARAFRASRRAP